MKIRNGFVSNSSSSSFTCDICGETEVIYDGIGDVDGVVCQSEWHSFHKSCGEKYNIVIKEVMIDGYEELAVTEETCPLCNLDIIDDDVILRYLLLTVFNTNRNNCKRLEKDDVRREIKKRFDNEQDTLKWIKENENED